MKKAKKSELLIFSIIGAASLLLTLLLENQLLGVQLLFVFICEFSFLFASRHASKVSDYVLVGLFFAVSFGIKNCWIFGVNIMAILVFLIFAVIGIITYFIFILDSVIIKKKYNFLTILIFPILSTVLNAIIVLIRVGDTSLITNSLYGLPIARQIFSLVGELGVYFLVLFIVSIIVYIFDTKKKSSVIPGVAIILVIIIGTYTFGAIRISQKLEPIGTIKVGIAIGPKAGTFNAAELPSFDKQLDVFKNQMKESSEKGVQFFAPNEEYFLIDIKDEETMKENACELAKQYKIPIMLPYQVTDESKNPPKENKVSIIDKDGNFIDTTLKYNLVPFVEGDGKRNEGNLTTTTINIDNKDYSICAPICFDANNTFYCKTMDKDANICFNPAWEWPGADVSQVKSIGARTIENGVTTIKPVYDGITLVLDPYGEAIEMIDSRGEYEKLFVVDVPITSCETVYNKLCK